MFLRSKNTENFFGLNYQAGDMKQEDEDDEETNYDDYNTCYFRFGRTLLQYDKQQKINEANEKWLLEPRLEKKSPAKVKFSEVVSYVEPSDGEKSEEENEENDKDDIEEDFEMFTNRLLDEIVNDLKKLPDIQETTSVEEINVGSDDDGTSDQRKKQYESKRRDLDNKIVKINENHVDCDNNNSNVLDEQTNIETNCCDHSSTNTEQVAVEHSARKSSLKPILKKCIKIPTILHSNENNKSLSLKKKKQHGLQSESQKDLNKYTDFSKKTNRKKLKNPNLNNLTNQNTVSENCHNTTANNQKTEKSNISITNLIETEGNIPILDAKRIPKILLKNNTSKITSKKYKLSDENICNDSFSTIMNKKQKTQTKNAHKLQIKVTNNVLAAQKPSTRKTKSHIKADSEQSQKVSTNISCDIKKSNSKTLSKIQENDIKIKNEIEKQNNENKVTFINNEKSTQRIVKTTKAEGKSFHSKLRNVSDKSKNKINAGICN